MKPFEYYATVDVPYPDRRDFVSFVLYDKTSVVADTIDGIKEVLGMQNFKTFDYHDAEKIAKQKQLVLGKFEDKDGFLRARDAYYQSQRKFHDEFKRDLFEEHGVTENPKAPLLYDKAYSMGHSSGYQEVANIFDDLVDLIK